MGPERPVLLFQVMLALCMRRRAPPPAKEMPEWEEECAVACAVQNLWLTATARGAAGVLVPLLHSYCIREWSECQ